MRSNLGRFHRPMSRGLVNNMLTMNNLGDGSTLNLDFTTGVLDPRLTFTRSTTATYINSSGYVTSAAINAPRFDYSPTNIGEPRGLLIEGQAVNIVKYSNAFTSGDWYLGGTPAVLTSNYAVGPDGVTGSAWRFTAQGPGFPSNSVFATPVANGGAAHVVSIYAKSNTGSNQTFTIYNGSSGTTCTATNVWQRFVVPVAGAWAYAYFGTLGTNQDILIWGAQSELGTSGASSYIPTGASQVTRNADDCTATGTNFSSWWSLSQSAFTVYWDGDITKSPATTQFCWLTRASGSSRSRGYVTTGSLIRANSTVYDFTMSPTTSMTVGTRFKSAVAISSGSSAMYANNSTVTGSDTSASAVTLFDADSLNFNPNADNFMHIRAFKFYPIRLENTQLQALVT